MAGVYHRSSGVGDYSTYHFNSALSKFGVGKAVSTTTSTTITGGQVTTVTTAAGGCANIEVNMMLTICGTGQEDVRVTAVNPTANTFTAFFTNSHSGTVSIASRRATLVGLFIVGSPGSGLTITLYDGHPDASYSKIISVITPVSTRGDYPFECVADYGLFVTASGTTFGDFTIQYIDVAAK